MSTEELWERANRVLLPFIPVMDTFGVKQVTVVPSIFSHREDGISHFVSAIVVDLRDESIAPCSLTIRCSEDLYGELANFVRDRYLPQE